MTTQYEIDIRHDLQTLDASVAAYGESTYATEERRRLMKVLEVEIAKPKVYIIAYGERSTIEAYLGFGARISVDINGAYYVVCVNEEHGAWQAGRLASGLHGGHVYYTLTEATLAAVELVGMKKP